MFNAGERVVSARTQWLLQPGYAKVTMFLGWLALLVSSGAATTMYGPVGWIGLAVDLVLPPGFLVVVLVATGREQASTPEYWVERWKAASS